MPEIRPNLIILLSDQLRRRALSMHGDPDVRTPHIDGLAAAGVRFDNACSTYPICVPFRFTMMTGQYAHTRRVPGIEWSMSPVERTLADEFNEADYETIYVGKWHLDGGHGRLGSAQQCNRMRVRRSQQGRWLRWSGFELRNGYFDTAYFRDDDPTPHLIDGHQTGGLFEIGMQHLRERDGRPFCMTISFEAPHPPFEAPAELQQAWEQREISLPPNFEIGEPQRRNEVLLDRKRYNAMVEDIDDQVGRLRQFLDAADLADNTIIVFLADHGEHGGAHGLTEKQWPYEESVGVPLVVYDPRQPERAGTVLRDPVATEDLFPTFLGLAGLQPRDVLPGTDLTALIRGETSALDRPGVLLEFVAELRTGSWNPPFYDKVWRGFRSERYKYTVRGNNLGSEPWQFFDLEADPWELSNLIDEPAARNEITSHHRSMRERMLETEDHFLLSPAWGVAGLNCWQA